MWSDVERAGEALEDWTNVKTRRGGCKGQTAYLLAKFSAIRFYPSEFGISMFFLQRMVTKINVYRLSNIHETITGSIIFLKSLLQTQ